MSFLLDNGLSLTDIEIGSGVFLRFAKPSIRDTLCVSRHGHATWLSEPPKNDARRNSMSKTMS